MSGQLQTPAALTPGKEPPVPFGQEFGWAPGQVWKVWCREKCCTVGNPTCAIQPVAEPTGLSLQKKDLDPAGI
jgi:hypothetical protein